MVKVLKLFRLPQRATQPPTAHVVLPEGWQLDTASLAAAAADTIWLQRLQMKKKIETLGCAEQRVPTTPFLGGSVQNAPATGRTQRHCALLVKWGLELSEREFDPFFKK